MKYIILIGDGMADYPVSELNGRTPLEAAKTPNMDYIAQHGRMGRVNTIPHKMHAGSDVATVNILGYDPKEYYTGRGPLEAANLNIDLAPDDVAFRCNLVTVSDNVMIDYSAGHICTLEAAKLIAAVDKKFGSEDFRFYAGVSYRHIMVARAGIAHSLDRITCKAPHDIAGQKIGRYFPKGKGAEIIKQLMESSRLFLQEHEINLVRVDLRENPANMLWLWGQGKKPDMPLFKDKFGVTGSMISAVDLLKGLGKILGLDVINVPGATGYYDTNYEGKASAGLEALKKNDFVLVHLEAPDEAGHNGDLGEKIRAIERFDQFIVGAFLQEFKDRNDYRLLVLPDHHTPVAVRTHTPEPVCFGIMGAGIEAGSFAGYSEKEAAASELSFDKGYSLMEYLIRGVK